MKLTKEADLAAEWELTAEQMRLLRRKHQWAHVRLSRQDIRYTDAQVEQIVRDMTVRGEKPAGGESSGLTRRSAAYLDARR